MISALFTHHLDDTLLIRFLRWMEGHAALGWFSNDLHRHAVSHTFARAMVASLPVNRLVVHDAPLSVARAFTASRLGTLAGRRRLRPRRRIGGVVHAVPLRRGPDQVMWDAAIVGGGPAGAAAACLLARAGRQTVLFEREAGPRHKVCGEFISVEAAAYLTSLGLDPERLGAVPIHHVRLIQGERTATATLPFPAFSLSRDVMDEALLNAAAGQGAEIRRGVHRTRPDRGRRRRHPPGRRTGPRPRRLSRHRKA